MGGVLEHPSTTSAWRAFGLMTPPRSGGWVSAGLGDPGWNKRERAETPEAFRDLLLSIARTARRR